MLKNWQKKFKNVEWAGFFAHHLAITALFRMSTKSMFPPKANLKKGT
jgi:hypothetical protein